eukprot:8378062-Pyramimonas_sp.AAC.1
MGATTLVWRQGTQALARVPVGQVVNPLLVREGLSRWSRGARRASVGVVLHQLRQVGWRVRATPNVREGEALDPVQDLDLVFDVLAHLPLAAGRG